MRARYGVWRLLAIVPLGGTTRTRWTITETIDDRRIDPMPRPDSPEPTSAGGLDDGVRMESTG
jgi:hypothetical protein